MKPEEIKTGKIYHMVAPGYNEDHPIDDLCIVFSAAEKCSIMALSENGNVSICEVSHYCIQRLAEKKEVNALREKALKAIKERKIPKDIKKQLLMEIHIYFKVPIS